MVRVRAILTVATIVAVAFVAPRASWAGGMPDEEADQQMPPRSIVGFVKDTDGNIIAEARVVANYKAGNTELITRTDATGHFRIPGFSKDVNTDDVEVACSKSGYQQTASLKRRPVAESTTAPIEVDCTLKHD
jgi:hypothetical protein